MFTIIIMMIVLFIGFLAKRAVLDIMEWVSPWGLDNSQEWDAPHMLPIIIIIITIIIILPQMKLPWNPKVPQSTKIAPEIHIFYDIAHIYSKGKKGTLFNLCKLHRSNQLNDLSRFWWRLWRPSIGKGGRELQVRVRPPFPCNLFANNCVKKVKVKVVYAILTVQSLKRARVGRKYSKNMFLNLLQ